MDVYFEQSLINDNIDRHSKRTKTLTVIRYVCIAVIVLIVLLAITLLIDISSVASFFVSLLLVLLMMAPFVLTYIFLGRMIANGNLEFDYLLNGSMFRIVKVINRKKRKKAGRAERIFFRVARPYQFGGLRPLCRQPGRQKDLCADRL